MAKKDVNYDFLKEHMGDVDGYDGMNMDTMAVPFIKILQAMSPQLRKNKAAYIADAEEGNIINSITGRIYEKPLRFVVGKFDRVYTEWKPNRGGFAGIHAPEEVETNPAKYQYVLNSNGGTDLTDTATGNVLVDTYMYYILLPDYVEDGVCLLSCQMTQLKEAKKLNRMLKTTMIPGTQNKALPHFMIWTLDTFEDSNDKGDWVGIKFNFEGFVNAELLGHVVDERKELPNKKVDYAMLDEDAGKTQTGVNEGEVKY